MQKKIIALAVAGLVSGVAFAQSNVTVYGIADVDYVYSKTNNGLTGANRGDYKFSGLRDGVDDGLNGSRIGFKGEEGLGNGLKAIFLIELRVNVATGDQTQPTRQSYVGLNSAYAGTFTLGRQYSAAGDIYGNFSSNAVTGINPVNTFQGVGGSQIVSGGGNSRQSNAVKWVSPNWSGFTTRLSYAFSNNGNAGSASYNQDAETTDNGRWAGSLDYQNGPLELGAIYARTSNAFVTAAGTGLVGSPTYAINQTTGAIVLNPAAATVPGAPAYYGAGGFAFATPAANSDPLQGKNINEWFLGGSYDLKIVKLYGTYQKMSAGTDAVLGVTDSKLWQLGAGIPLGNGRLNLEYAEARFNQDNNTNAATAQDGKNKGFGIGYEYYFSKRTTAYAYYSRLKFDSNTASTNGAPTGVPVQGGSLPGTAALGETTNSMSVGMRHVF